MPFLLNIIKLSDIHTDIDECNTDSDNCDANAVCTNTPGGFTCKCKKGYEGHGKTCTGIIIMLCRSSTSMNESF